MTQGDSETTTIRLSALCTRRVHDAQDHDVGRVLDVRAVQDGPVRDGTGAAIRVNGLVVGPNGIGERLGLLRHRVQGPWLVVWLARLLAGRSRYLPWDQVVDPSGLVDPGTPVRFRGELRELDDWQS